MANHAIDKLKAYEGDKTVAVDGARSVAPASPKQTTPSTPERLPAPGWVPGSQDNQPIAIHLEANDMQERHGLARQLIAQMPRSIAFCEALFTPEVDKILERHFRARRRKEGERCEGA